MRKSAHGATLMAIGILLAFNTRAHSNEAIDASRETIIQGVRDDVRRKIQERNELPPETRPEAASEGKPPPNAPEHGNSKQETPK